MEMQARPLLRFPPPSPQPLQKKPGCFEKWDIASNGFQTPQKFIRKRGVLKNIKNKEEGWWGGGVGWGVAGVRTLPLFITLYPS